MCGAAGESIPGVHLLAAYAHEAQVVLGQLRVDAKTNEHKAALELLAVLPLKGAVVTADASRLLELDPAAGASKTACITSAT